MSDNILIFNENSYQRNAKTFTMDTLVMSVFNYIGLYLDVSDMSLIASDSLNVMGELTYGHGFIPQSYVYFMSDDNLDKLIQDVNFEHRPILLGQQATNLVETLTEVYNSEDEDFNDCPITEQQVLDYFFYLYIDDFFNFFCTGKSLNEFPSKIKVMNRENLHPVLLDSLNVDPDKIYFRPVLPYERGGSRIGVRGRNPFN